MHVFLVLGTSVAVVVAVVVGGVVVDDDVSPLSPFHGSQPSFTFLILL